MSVSRTCVHSDGSFAQNRLSVCPRWGPLFLVLTQKRTVLSAQVQLKRLFTSPKWEIKMSFDHTHKFLKEMLKIAKRIEFDFNFKFLRLLYIIKIMKVKQRIKVKMFKLVIFNMIFYNLQFIVRIAKHKINKTINSDFVTSFLLSCSGSKDHIYCTAKCQNISFPFGKPQN